MIHKFFICFFLLNQSVQADSVKIDSGRKLLAMTKAHSLEYSKIQQQLELDELNTESLMSLYRWRLTGNLSISDAESAPTSPFAPAGASDSLNGSLRLEKQTSLGITPYVSLSTDSRQSLLPVMPTPINVEYKRAVIETGVRFNIMNLVFAKNSKFVSAEYDTKKEISKVSKIIAERTLEKKLLSAHFDVIKANKIREVLNIQCAQYKKLRDITSSRFRKKLIREKDFLLVEVLYKQCLVDEEGARNSFRLAVENLKKASGLFNFSLDYNTIEYPDISPVINLGVGQNRDIILSDLIYKASMSAAKSIEYKKLPELNLSLSLKSEGSDVGSGSSYSEALSNSLEADFLTSDVSLDFSHSFGKSVNDIEVDRSKLQSKVDQTNLELLRQSLKRDVVRVGLNLSYFDSTLRRVVDIEKLQKRKSVVFNKDFRNGRVAIRELVEAEVAYLSSLQSTLNIRDQRMRAYLEAYDISGASFEKFY